LAQRVEAAGEVRCEPFRHVLLDDDDPRTISRLHFQHNPQ
jgi:hypothetical protein